MKPTHHIEIEHAEKRKNGELQYIFRIVELRSRKTIASGQQYSRKVDVIGTVEHAFGELLQCGTFILVDKC